MRHFFCTFAAAMNRIEDIFGIKYPVIAGGMAWCSGWRLAAAVSNAGGLGLIGAGTMTVDLLREHIQKIKTATTKPWGINLPLMYPQIDSLIDMIIEEGCKIIFTSAGSPKKYTQRFHDAGMIVAHVVSSSKFARKCEEAGVDVVVAEGFEAGGHNGKEETTTMCLIPQVRKATTLPLIAAGGIASGQACLAAQVLGAEGVQIGTLFALACSNRHCVVHTPCGRNQDLFFVIVYKTVISSYSCHFENVKILIIIYVIAEIFVFVL